MQLWRNEIEIKIRNTKLKNKVEEAQTINTIMLFVNFFIVIGMTAGIVLTTMGFRLWYHKLQKFQDEIIINEARKSRPADKEEHV